MVNTDNGAFIPGAYMELTATVADKVPRDRMLSLKITWATLSGEYKDYPIPIKFEVIDLFSELKLVCHFNTYIEPSTKEHELIGILDALFNIIRGIQGRMSNGVLIR